MVDYYMVPALNAIGDIPVGGTSYSGVPYRNKFIESIFAYLPKGAFWTPKRGGFFERFLYGLMDAFELVRLVLSDLAHIRDAKLTQQLDDLELDYGISKNPELTIEERRAVLFSRINAINNTGSAQEMQAALRLAGFDVFVYSNSPAVDPAGILNFGSKLLVNGDVYFREENYLMRAGQSVGFAGNSNARAGRFISSSMLYEYVLPANSDAWPFVFFVGGNATFGGSGEIVSLDFATVPESQRLQFEEIVLKYKPTFTWAGLKINYL